MMGVTGTRLEYYFSGRTTVAHPKGAYEARVHTAFPANDMNELPPNCGEYLQTLCRASKTAGRVQARCNQRGRECIDGRQGGQASVKDANPGGRWLVHREMRSLLGVHGMRSQRCREIGYRQG